MINNEKMERLASPLTMLITRIENDLLVNAAKHFKGGKGLTTSEWQMRKMAELGILQKESIDIIAKNLLGSEPIVMTTFQTAAYSALDDIEPKLANAAKKGYLGTTAPISASRGINEVIRSFTANEMNSLNMMGTTMLNSSLDAYIKGVNSTVTYANYLSANQIMNYAGLTASSGLNSVQAASTKAIQEMAREGITAFVDKAGHHWSPEAYVNMTVRTAVTNTAHATTKARMADYGLSIFEVSSHAGARELCEPYQGKLYSWDGSEGEVADLNGHMIHYESIYNTSYGDPGGLFGINCGHFENPFIPGYSSQAGDLGLSEKENEEIYQQSQEQRAIERDIREAKREAEMQLAAGNQAGFEKAAVDVKEATSHYNSFLNDTGRTARPDRTQVVGYNQQTAGAVASTYNNYIKTH